MHKLIKRYQLGGGLTSPTYTPTYNTGTDLYNNITNPNFNNINNSFTNAVQPNLKFQSKLGDTTALGLSANSQLSQGLKSPVNGESSKGVVGSSSESKTPKVGNAMNLISGATSTLYNTGLTLNKTVNSNDAAMESFRKSAFQNMAQSNNPYVKFAGVLNMGIDMTGGFTDASQGLGKKTDTINKIAALALPGAGWFAKRTDKYKMSNTLKENASAYGGTFAKGKIAQQNANAKFLVGRKKANYLASEVRRQDGDINNIMNKAQDAFLASNNAQTIGLQNQMDLNGVNWNKALRAKEGLKLDRNFAQQVIKLSKDKKNNAQNVQVDIIEFKNGGAFNVIPSGALHAHKHHLEDVDEKFEEVTTKGIPVITENEEGIVQHAEVEKEEIIFNLEVTKQLEKLMQDGSDEAAIEAGKLLVHEILENTVDNTGLLNKIK